MTVKDLLADIDLKNPNDVQESVKRGWILTQEKLLLDEVLHTHVLSSEEAETAEALAAFREGRKSGGETTAGHWKRAVE